MSPKTFIFIGRSGSGKGTQVAILRQKLDGAGMTADSSAGSMAGTEKLKTIYLETGARFREFIKGPSYSNKLAAHIAETGHRQPDFLAVWNWAHVLIEEMTGKEHLIVDGMPRSYEEALVFDSSITFYNREKPTVIYIDVSKEWSRERLRERSVKEGRPDDMNAENVERRLSWFDTDVYPAVKYFSSHPGYYFIHVNGEQPIDKVAADILEKLSW